MLRAAALFLLASCAAHNVVILLLLLLLLRKSFVVPFSRWDGEQRTHKVGEGNGRTYGRTMAPTPARPSVRLGTFELLLSGSFSSSSSSSFFGLITIIEWLAAEMCLCKEGTEKPLTQGTHVDSLTCQIGDSWGHLLTRSKLHTSLFI